MVQMMGEIEFTIFFFISSITFTGFVDDIMVITTNQQAKFQHLFQTNTFEKGINTYLLPKANHG